MLKETWQERLHEYKQEWLERSTPDENNNISIRGKGKEKEKPFFREKSLDQITKRAINPQEPSSCLFALCMAHQLQYAAGPGAEAVQSV